MTGIDRLRALAGAWDEWGLGGTLAEMADEIERELSEERDRWDDDLSEAQVSWNAVAGVCLDMERHCLGHEGMEDSPVASWARELRGALKSDASDGPEAQNPSCTDPDGAADVTSEAQKVTRDPAEDVSMSAYDLLSDDDRKALAWVREMGGLKSVKSRLEWVVGHCSTKQQLDFDFWLSGRVMYELGFEEDMADRDEVEGRLLARLMPEGCQWPRYESGEPVGFGDEVSRLGEVFSISLYRDGSFALNFRAYSKGERVRRPAPKVLDADGVEIREERDVWWICEGDERGVHAERLRVETICPNGLIECSPHNGGTWVELEPSELYVNKPVPASDGRPLREGETVWLSERGFKSKLVDRGEPLKVVAFDKNGSVGVLDRDGIALGETSPWWFNPSCLTHERPESKCRDCAHWQKDPTADNMGVCWFLYHEYEGQDCYSARLSDIGACEEFMPSARALAERERGE